MSNSGRLTDDGLDRELAALGEVWRREHGAPTRVDLDAVRRGNRRLQPRTWIPVVAVAMAVVLIFTIVWVGTRQSRSPAIRISPVGTAQLPRSFEVHAMWAGPGWVAVEGGDGSVQFRSASDPAQVLTTIASSSKQLLNCASLFGSWVVYTDVGAPAGNAQTHWTLRAHSMSTGDRVVLDRGLSGPGHEMPCAMGFAGFVAWTGGTERDIQVANLNAGGKPVAASTSAPGVAVAAVNGGFLVRGSSAHTSGAMTASIFNPVTGQLTAVRTLPDAFALRGSGDRMYWETNNAPDRNYPLRSCVLPACRTTTLMRYDRLGGALTDAAVGDRFIASHTEYFRSLIITSATAELSKTFRPASAIPFVAGYGNVLVYVENTTTGPHGPQSLHVVRVSP